MADDLGYGDLKHYNNNSKIKTPHLDRLARQGMSFMDMHSTSSVCTPTRYSILTGEYAWRTQLKKGVLWSYGPLMIPDQKETVHAMTLRAFIKERVESGDDFPMELFGAYVGQRAIITGGSK